MELKDTIYPLMEISKIIISENRFRKICEQEQLQRLASSMQKRGQKHPILIDEHNELIAGFHRYSAAKDILEWTHIEYRLEKDLSILEKRILEIEENIHTSFTWAESATAHAEIHRLFVEERGKATQHVGGGQSIVSTAEELGISKSTLAEDIKLAGALKVMPELANLNKKAAMNKIALIQETLIREELTERIIEIDSHKDIHRESAFLLVGSALEVLKHFPDNSIDLIITDPPWGTAASREDILVGFERPEGIESLVTFLAVLPELFRVMKESHLYVFIASPTMDVIGTALWNVGFAIRWIPLIVVKRQVRVFDARMDFSSAYFSVIFARKGNRPLSGEKTPQDLFHTTESLANIKYSNQKPTDVIAQFINASSDPGNVVLDPFTGSSSTLIAAIKSNRRAIGIDISNAAISISQERITEIFPDVPVVVKDWRKGSQTKPNSAELNLKGEPE